MLHSRPSVFITLACILYIIYYYYYCYINPAAAEVTSYMDRRAVMSALVTIYR